MIKGFTLKAAEKLLNNLTENGFVGEVIKCNEIKNRYWVNTFFVGKEKQSNEGINMRGLNAIQKACKGEVSAQVIATEYTFIQRELGIKLYTIKNEKTGKVYEYPNVISVNFFKN